MSVARALGGAPRRGRRAFAHPLVRALGGEAIQQPEEQRYDQEIPANSSARLGLTSDLSRVKRFAPARESLGMSGRLRDQRLSGCYPDEREYASIYANSRTRNEVVPLSSGPGTAAGGGRDVPSAQAACGRQAQQVRRVRPADLRAKSAHTALAPAIDALSGSSSE
jgi:hypothetical protein